MNKPLYIWGLTSSQLLIAFISITFSVVISIVAFGGVWPTITVLVISGSITFSFFKKISKENKKGDPNNLESRTSFKAMKKKFVDSDNILQRLYEERNRK